LNLFKNCSTKVDSVVKYEEIVLILSSYELALKLVDNSMENS